MTDLERFAEICAESWTKEERQRLSNTAQRRESFTEFERFAATLTAWEEE